MSWIISFPGLLAQSECRDLSMLELGNFFNTSKPCKVASDAPPCNTLYTFNHNQLAGEISVRLTKRLRWDRAVEVNPYFRLYLNKPGTRVPPHHDSSRSLPSGVASTHSLLIYLNDAYEGGQTFFSRSNEMIEPVEGHAIAFPHSLHHEGMEVKACNKITLRSDIFLRGDHLYSTTGKETV
jgi:hypothetical protein